MKQPQPLLYTNDDGTTYIVDPSKTSKTLVYELLEHDNPHMPGKLPITEDLFTLTDPSPNNDPTHKRNTTITGTVTQKWTDLEKYKGTKQLWYDRIDIGNYLQNFVPIEVPNKDVKTMVDVFNYIKQEFNLGLTMDEIKNDPIDPASEDTQYMDIKDNCLAWIASVGFKLYSVIPDLNVIVNVKDTPELSYPGQTHITNGDVYGYAMTIPNLDLPYITNLRAGTIIGDSNLSKVLQRSLPYGVGDSYQWVHDINSNNGYNTYGMSVAYNGVTRAIDKPKAGATHVIVLKGDNKYLTNIYGNITIYYSPESFSQYSSHTTVTDEEL